MKSFIKDDKIILQSVFITSLSPLLIMESQNGKAYMMAAFMGLFTTWILQEKIINNNNFSNGYKFIWAIVYGIIAAILFLTYYLSVSILLAHAIFVLYLRNFKLFKYLLLSLFIFSLIVGHWIYFYGIYGYKNMQILSMYYTINETNQTNYPVNFAYGFIRLLSLNFHIGIGLISFVRGIHTFLVMLLFITILIYGIFNYLKSYTIYKNKIPDSLILIFFCSIMPVLFLSFNSLLVKHTTTFSYNYAIFGVPFSAVICVISYNHLKFRILKVIVFSMFMFLWLFWALNYYNSNNSIDKELQVAYHIINDLKKGNNQFEYSFPNYKKAANVAFYLLEPKLICKITYDNGTVDSVMKKDLNSNKWIFIERLD